MIENFDHPKCSLGVFGCSGHGKSTLFEKILRENKADFWFYYDHKGEFSKRWKLHPVYDLAGLASATAHKVCCFDPSRLFAGQKSEGFLFFCDFVFEVCGQFKGRKILVCDELQQVALQDNPEELVRVMDDGRRRGLDTFFIGQSPNQLGCMVRNQFTEIFTMRQADENATKFLKQVGFDEQTMLDLKPGMWLYRNVTTGEAKSGGKAFKIKSSAKYNF